MRSLEPSELKTCLIQLFPVFKSLETLEWTREWSVLKKNLFKATSVDGLEFVISAQIHIFPEPDSAIFIFNDKTDGSEMTLNVVRTKRGQGLQIRRRDDSLLNQHEHLMCLGLGSGVRGEIYVFDRLSPNGLAEFIILRTSILDGPFTALYSLLLEQDLGLLVVGLGVEKAPGENPMDDILTAFMNLPEALENEELKSRLPQRPKPQA